MYIPYITEVLVCVSDRIVYDDCPTTLRVLAVLDRDGREVLVMKKGGTFGAGVRMRNKWVVAKRMVSRLCVVSD